MQLDEIQLLVRDYTHNLNAVTQLLGVLNRTTDKQARRLIIQSIKKHQELTKSLTVTFQQLIAEQKGLLLQ